MSHRRSTLLPVLSTLLLLGLGFFLDPFGTDEPDRAITSRSAAGASPAYAPEEFERLRDPVTGRIPHDIRQRERAYVADLPRRTEDVGRVGNAAAKGEAIYSWEHRGPSNVGGRTRALAFDVNDENVLLAGGATGGMWRSTDGGGSWVNTTDPDDTFPVTTLVQDRRAGKTDTWYVGTGENSSSGSGFNFFALYLGDGLYKSTDNGQSWQPLSATTSGTPQLRDPNDVVWRLALDASNLDEDVVYMASGAGISRSIDGGNSWEVVIESSNSYTDVAVTPEGIVYAALSRDGRRQGIYRSDDGVMFTDITPTQLRFRTERTVIGLVPSNPNRFYIIAETPQSGAEGKDLLGRSVWHSLWSYTYRSGDGSGEGGLWEDLSANVPLFGGSFGDFNSQGGYDLTIAVKPDDERVVFVGGTNLYRSTNGFTTSDSTTWLGGYRDAVFDLEENKLLLRFDYPNHHPDIHTLLFSEENPNVLLTGSDGGIHKTEDCLRADSIDWIPLSNGYLTTQFYSVAIDHETPGSRAIAGGMQDNGTWRTTTGERTEPWIYTGSGDGAFTHYGGGGRYLYVAKQRGRLYRVELDEAGAQTGATRLDPEVDDFDAYRFINPFLIDPSDRRILYTLYSRDVLFNRNVVATPLGNTRPVEQGWETIPIETSIALTSIGISERNPSHRLFVGGGRGQLFRIDDPLGNEPVPVDVTSALFVDGAYSACTAVDPVDGDHALAVFSNYGIVSLFETTDAGESWRSVSGNLEENPDGSGAGPSCRWSVILRRGSKLVYLVGTSAGLFSTDQLEGDNTEWVREGAETIGNRIVDMIDGRTSDGFVAIGTHGGGVYSTTIEGLDVEEVGIGGVVLDLR